MCILYMPVVSMRGTVTGRAMAQPKISYAPPRVAPRITPRVEHRPLNRYIPSVAPTRVATRMIQTSATPARPIVKPKPIAKPRARTKKNVLNAQMKRIIEQAREYRPGSQNHLVEHGRVLIQHGQSATDNLIHYGQTTQNGPGMNNGHLNALLTRLAIARQAEKNSTRKPRKPRKSRARPKIQGNALGTKF